MKYVRRYIATKLNLILKFLIFIQRFSQMRKYKKNHPKDFNFDSSIIRGRENKINKRYNIKQDDVELKNNRITIVKAQGAWNDMLVDYKVYCPDYVNDITSYLLNIKNEVINLIQKELKEKVSSTIQLVL